MLRARVTALIAAVLSLAAIVAATRSPSAQAQAAAFKAAGDVVVSNSKNGSAILGGQIAPGHALSGEVTIGNIGWAPGDFVLQESSIIDTLGPNGGRLSDRLQLEVDDVTNPDAPAAVYVGTLGSFTSRDLGTFNVKASRTYRLTVSFPDGGASDLQVMASTVSVTFSWMAQAISPSGPPSVGSGGGGQPPGDPANPPRDRLAAPKLSFRAAKRQRVLKRHALLARVRCDQPCTVRMSARLSVGRASKAVKLGRHRWSLRAKQTTRLRVKLPAKVLRKLRVRLAHHNRPLIKLTATATASGGKGRPVRRSVRVIG